MSTYPASMLLSINNVSNWEYYMKNKLTAFPDIGQAIRNKTPYVLTKPTFNDLIEDSDVRMCNFQANDPTTLADSSLTNFLKAKSAFKNEDKDRRDEEAKVCRLILSYLSVVCIFVFCCSIYQRPLTTMTSIPCSRLLKTSIPDPPALQSPRAPFNSY